MAVVSVDLIHTGWQGTWNRLFQRNYTVAWRVWCSSRLDGPVTIRNATHTVVIGGTPTAVPLVPRIGNSYYITDTERDAGSFASDITYALEDIGSDDDGTGTGTASDGCEWVVTANYTPYDALQFSDTPVDWPIKVTFTSNKYERVLQVDVNGEPVVNSAGMPFGDPLMVDDSRSIITVVRNERIDSVPASGGSPAVPGFDYTLAEVYRDSINEAEWNGFAAKYVKCSSITTGDPQFDSNNKYWYYVVTYVFEINRDTWTKKVVDQGLYHLVSGNLVRITDSKGQPADEPELLDGSGAPLAEGAAPVELEFEGYPILDFGVFNLDFDSALGKEVIV